MHGCMDGWMDGWMIRHAHVVRRRVLEPRLGDLPAVSRVRFDGAYDDTKPQTSSLTLTLTLTLTLALTLTLTLALTCW